MAFTKITQSELNSRGATRLEDKPTIPSSQLKREFDAPAKEIVAPKFNNLIDELEATTAAADVGAVAPTGYTGANVQGVLDSVASSLSTLSSSVGEAIADAHTHSNKIVLDKFSEVSGVPTYNGSPLSTEWGSIGGPLSNQTDLKDALDGKAAASHTHTTSDITNFPTIPDELADLSDDSTHRVVTDTEKSTWNGKSTVAWNQIISTGQKIATVTIDGTPKDVYAPTGGGGGGGGDVDSVNGQTGTVVLGVSDIDDVQITSIQPNHILQYNGTSTKWENKALPTVDQNYNASSANAQSGTAVAQGIAAGVAHKADISSLITKLRELTDVTETSPTDGQVLTYNNNGWVNANLPTVDQTYNQSSANAQSGTAVAGAISGKANSSDLDEWFGTTATVSSGQFSFSGLDDTKGYGFEPYIQVDGNSTNKNPSATINTISGAGTASMSLTYDTDADNGASVKLRIIK